MRRLSREVEVFSISALDLFASALGVFMIITFILFPYYRKSGEAETRVAALTEQSREAQRTAEQARSDAQDAVMKAEQARDPEDEQRLRVANQRLQQAEARLAAQKAELAKLNAQAQRVVEFAILGLPTKGKSFVLLVDMSSSMREYAALMTATVDRILDTLDQDSRIAIVGYHAPGGGVQLHEWPAAGRLEPMTSAGKTEAQRFAHGLQSRFEGSTPTRAALEKALDYKADAVLLISDGAPTDAPPDAILDAITKANSGKKEIHAVALGNYNKEKGLVDFLQRLSRQNKGGFVGVSR